MSCSILCPHHSRLPFELRADYGGALVKLEEIPFRAIFLSAFREEGRAYESDHRVRALWSGGWSAPTTTKEWTLLVALFNPVSLSFPDRASFSKDELHEWHRAWLAFIAGKNAREAPPSTRLPASAALARSLLCSLPGAESNNICYAVCVYEVRYVLTRCLSFLCAMCLDRDHPQR
eukprot:scaffold12306_cov147-Isochrysis_galbana.AAC.3